MDRPFMIGTRSGASKLATFQVCHQKYKWAFVDNLVKISGSPSASFGSAIHEGLYTFYTEKDQPRHESELKAIARAVEFVEATTFDSVAKELLRDEVVAALDQYFQKYNPETLLPIACEQSFKLDIRGFEYTGRLDFVGRWILEGKEYLVVPDHKTTGMDWERFFKQWQFDLALRGYAYAARKILGEPVHVLINAIRRRKTKTFEVEFDRQLLFFDDDMMDSFEDEVQSIYLDIQDRIEGRRAWDKNGKACVGMFTCDYYDLCRFPSQSMKDTMFKQREEGGNSA